VRRLVADLVRREYVAPAIPGCHEHAQEIWRQAIVSRPSSDDLVDVGEERAKARYKADIQCSLVDENVEKRVAHLRPSAAPYLR